MVRDDDGAFHFFDEKLNDNICQIFAITGDITINLTNPNGIATRARIATILMSYIEKQTRFHPLFSYIKCTIVRLFPLTCAVLFAIISENRRTDMVVFFDVDGTIIDNKTQIIPTSTVRAVEKLRERGHIPVINTGRPYTHIDPRVRAIPFTGWICACGSEIWLNQVRIFWAVPDPETCRLTIASVRQCGMQAVYEADNGLVLSDGDYSRHPLCQKKINIMKDRGFPIRDISTMAEPHFIKFMCYEWPGCDREAFAHSMEGRFDGVDRGRGRLELIYHGCDKARGMQILMEHLGLPMKDSLAIGDSTNDLPMFRMAGHTACMGNGMDELKQVSEYITASVLDDGIERALRHFGLIE